jgi:hypothetical protein
MPPKGSTKRRNSEPPVGSLAQRPKRDASAVAAVRMQDADDDDDDAADASRSPARGSRSAGDELVDIYDKYHTLLVWAWCHDYDTGRVTRVMRENRAALLAEIRANPLAYAPPEADDELEQLRLCAYKKKKGGLNLTKADANMLAGPEEDEDDEDEHEDEGEAAAAPAAAPAVTRTAAAAAPIATTPLCLCCFAPRDPVTSPGQMQNGKLLWLCGKCGHYGHQMRGSVDNIALASSRAPASSPAAPSSSSSSSAAGAHVPFTLQTAVTVGERHERRIALAVQKLPAVRHPAFSEGTDSTRVAAARAALSAQRGSIDALLYKAPSENLITLIQSGGLVDLTFAIPMLDAKAKAIPDTKGSDALLLAFGGSAGDAGDANAWTLDDFSRTLVTVILPCLAGQPQAQARWCQLYGDALGMRERYGDWGPARQYVNLVLSDSYERPQANPFGTRSTDIANACGRLAPQQQQRTPAANPRGSNSKTPASSPRPGPDSSSQGGTDRLPMSEQICRDWNSDRMCAMGTRCPRKHICSRCRGDHKLIAPCPHAQPNPYSAGAGLGSGSVRTYQSAPRGGPTTQTGTAAGGGAPTQQQA